MADFLEELKSIVGAAHVSVNESILELHSKDESSHKPCLPDAVVFPQSKEDVSRVLKCANDHKIPVVPFGLGTSLEGHVIPIRGGISLDLAQMNSILEVREHDFLVV